MPLWKKLDIIGSALVLLSAFVQLFLLDGIERSSLNGYIVNMMENQAVLKDLLIHLGHNMPANLAPGIGLAAEDMGKTALRFQLYSQTYSWRSELSVIGIIVGWFFIGGTGLVIVAKALEPNRKG